MGVTSNRTVTNAFSGEVVTSIALAAAVNTLSPGGISVYSLVIGANTITLPTGGSTPVAATIHPPSGNTASIILKGVSGDTGIQINKLDPTVITFDPAASPSNFILTAGGTVTGLRIIWS